ncbi:hypothetical protein F5I97DRAFT_1305716 [Phlebopus sp. FC_14]|nr:hypothetical protein F5I97DRAFT_1305716 [Phlebopus sp. FC_14]
MSLGSIAFFQTNAHVVSDVISHSFASLTFMTWDTLLMFGDEVEYVWVTPWKSKVKWLYLYLRYIALAMHVAFTTEIFHLTSGHTGASTCRAWTIFQWIIVLLNVMSLQSLLALCAYALCNQSRRITLLYLALMCLR